MQLEHTAAATAWRVCAVSLTASPGCQTVGCAGCEQWQLMTAPPAHAVSQQHISVHWLSMPVAGFADCEQQQLLHRHGNAYRQCVASVGCCIGSRRMCSNLHSGNRVVAMLLQHTNLAAAYAHTWAAIQQLPWCMAWRNTDCTTQLAALSSSVVNALLQHAYGLADNIHDVATRTVRQHMATTSCKIAV